MKNLESEPINEMEVNEEKETKQIQDENLESVDGGGFFNAPENPTCKYCKSRDTWTSGWMANWKVHCRACGAEYWEASILF